MQRKQRANITTRNLGLKAFDLGVVVINDEHKFKGKLRDLT